MLKSLNNQGKGYKIEDFYLCTYINSQQYTWNILNIYKGKNLILFHATGYDTEYLLH